MLTESQQKMVDVFSEIQSKIPKTREGHNSLFGVGLQKPRKSNMT